jgi:hypothetical protein
MVIGKIKRAVDPHLVRGHIEVDLNRASRTRIVPVNGLARQNEFCELLDPRIEVLHRLRLINLLIIKLLDVAVWGNFFVKLTSRADNLRDRSGASSLSARRRFRSSISFLYFSISASVSMISFFCACSYKDRTVSSTSASTKKNAMHVHARFLCVLRKVRYS